MEYGFYYTNIKKNICNIDDYIKNLINIYNIFLINLIKENPNIIVFGVNLCNPFLNWKIYIKNVIKMDKNEKNDIIDKLTYNNHNNNLLKFNNLLKELCKNLTIKYIDAIEIISDIKDDIYYVKKIYIGKDNHLQGAELSKYLNYNNDNLYGANTYLVFLQLLINNI